MEEFQMLEITDEGSSDPSLFVAPRNGSKPYRSSKNLAELLSHSIGLRNLYKCARWQTSSMPSDRLHLMFDAHYKDQIRLVDLLINEANASGATAHVFGGDCLGGSQFAYALYGRMSPVDLLRVLLERHGALQDALGDEGSPRDGVEKQMFLTNGRQLQLVNEEVAISERLRKSTAQSGVACASIDGPSNDRTDTIVQ
jgi:hypothetical protein